VILVLPEIDITDILYTNITKTTIYLQIYVTVR